MVNPIWFFLGAIVAAELYSRYATDEEKARWENYVKAHHGELGLLGTLLGATTGHYGVTATGLGLALHDINDIDKWFTSDKTGSA